jgi:malonyl-CoA/methylmalonyl-CoA synthetase
MNKQNMTIELIARAVRHGDKTAIRAEDREISYSGLLQSSAQIAGALLGEQSDLQEQRVAFLFPAGIDYACVQWAVWRAGGIAVPLNTGSSLPELEHVLSSAGVSQVIVPASQREKLAELCQQTGADLQVLEEMDLSDPPALPFLSGDRRAMILFTSGTTSKPKGVVSTHTNIQAQIEALVKAWAWQKDDSIPLLLPMHHIHGIVNVLGCALWTGAGVEAFSSFDMSRILDRVAAGAYNLFMAVPTIYVKLIQRLESMDEADKQLCCKGFAGMRLMVSGSAALPVEIHQTWQGLTGQVLLERYGMTEIGMALSNPLHGERRPGAVGQPLPGVIIRLVQEDGTVIEEEDVPGEIQVQGAAVFHEYWNDATATAKAFKDGWFMTGDMAVIERGYYRIMGRLSVDIIKSGGYKLSALEIEDALLGHPDISECAVVGVVDDTWGEAVAAAVVLQTDTSLTLEDLRQWGDDRMSRYKLPKYLQITDSLPRNAMGKVTKSEVKKLFM